MEFKRDAFYALLSQTNNESKVAAAILLSQHLTTLNVVSYTSNSSTGKLINDFIDRVGISFISQMIFTHSSNQLIAKSALTIMSHITYNQSLLVLFKSGLHKYIAFYYESLIGEKVEIPLTDQLRMICILIACASGEDVIISTIKYLLHDVQNLLKPIAPVEILSFLAMINMKWVEIKSSIPLNGQHETALADGDYQVLQSLFIQSFHGAAKESTRDRTLQIYLLIMHQCKHEFSVIKSNWCWLQLPNSEVGGKMNLQFLSFIHSIVRGEIHLSSEELIQLAMGEEGLPNDEQEKRINRFRRCSWIQFVSYQVLSHLLERLAEFSDAATSVAGNIVEGIPALQSIIFDIFNELVSFVRDISIIYSKMVNSDIVTRDELKAMIGQTVQLITSYCFENDQEYFETFLNTFDAILPCSDIPSDWIHSPLLTDLSLWLPSVQTNRVQPHPVYGNVDIQNYLVRTCPPYGNEDILVCLLPLICALSTIQDPSTSDEALSQAFNRRYSVEFLPRILNLTHGLVEHMMQMGRGDLPTPSKASSSSVPMDQIIRVLHYCSQILLDVFHRWTPDLTTASSANEHFIRDILPNKIQPLAAQWKRDASECKDQSALLMEETEIFLELKINFEQILLMMNDYIS